MPIRYSSVVGGSGSSGFNLDVGSSGNTTFVFSEPQPAGGYSITSQLSDITMEFYAIAEDGSLAGYTNTKSLTASQDFDTLVVYGATNNDLITFEFKPTTLPTGNGDQDSGAAPFVTSATPVSLPNVDDTTIVSGGNFAVNAEVKFIGQDDVEIAAKNVVRSSSTELIVTRPDNLSVDQEPYSLVITNPGITSSAILSNTLASYFDAGAAIAWVTNSGLPSAFGGQAYSTTLQATDPDAGSVTYTISSGSLPAGLSLNSSTGEISGTPTSFGPFAVTVVATDTGNNTATREFTLSAIDSAIEYLVVAGGGGGASLFGGGGAGGYRSSVQNESSGGGAASESPIPLNTSSLYNITVGAGGLGGPSTNVQSIGSNGTQSAFDTVVSIGGGGGGGDSADNAGDGGSGGGGSGWGTTSYPGGSGELNQGFDGGAGSSTNAGGGGGGGAAQLGAVGTSNGGGSGGNGVQSSINGTPTYRAAGGGGGTYTGTFPSSNGGQGGLGGGGTGGQSSSSGGAGSGSSALVNTGSGGGGGTRTAQNVAGGNGASGIVILKYPSSFTVLPNPGLVYSTSSDGDFSVTEFTSGEDTVQFAPTEEVVLLEYLVIAGGGSGGGNVSGGGGAGGYRSSVVGESSGGGASAEPYLFLNTGTNYTVTVGAGGSTYANGVNSTLHSITSVGGGAGANSSTPANVGGSGGGGSFQSTGAASGTDNQGYSGGSGTSNSGAGAGGGAGGNGGNGGGGNGGNGGPGVYSSITGSSVPRAGGGGGGAWSNGGISSGGVGGGGNGGDGYSSSTPNPVTATSGQPNTGGGGGGGSYFNSTNGNGGSGVVIIKYSDTKTLTVGPGLVSSTDSSSVPGYKITTFTSGDDTITFS